MKYIFVTGGVVSSLGKGIASASVGLLLKQRGLRVTLQKFDPYINVDPGTMSPFQHGEVFVTDDGGETDLDIGHYERLIDRNLSETHSVTTGKVYQAVIQRERTGGYLGKTVQVVPHITDEIKDRLKAAGKGGDVDVIITAIGGTTGDIESLPFLEACRQILADWRAEVVAGLPGIEKDQLFHQTLYKSVGNKLLASLVHIFWLAYRNAEERTIPVKSSRQNVLKYHVEIFEAVEARDAELAQRLIVEHFQRVEERFRLALEDSEQRKTD